MLQLKQYCTARRCYCCTSKGSNHSPRNYALKLFSFLSHKDDSFGFTTAGIDVSVNINVTDALIHAEYIPGSLPVPSHPITIMSIFLCSATAELKSTNGDALFIHSTTLNLALPALTILLHMTIR